VDWRSDAEILEVIRNIFWILVGHKCRHTGVQRGHCERLRLYWYNCHHYLATILKA